MPWVPYTAWGEVSALVSFAGVGESICLLGGGAPPMHALPAVGRRMVSGVWERERGCGHGLSQETAAPSPVFLSSMGIAEAACGVGGGMSRPRRLLLPRVTRLCCRCVRLLPYRVTRLCCRCIRLLPYRVTRLCCRCISGTPRPSGSPVRA